MKFCILLLLTALLAVNYCCAQIFPEPDEKLNYTQIMFEHPMVRGADMYLVQVKEDTLGNNFKNTFERKDSSTAIMISGFQFGKKYQWRYAPIKAGKLQEWIGPYNFEILIDSFLMLDLLKTTVIKNGTNTGGLIVMDCSHSAVDRQGNMVWYLPKVNWHLVPMGRKFEMKPQILDIQINAAGTVTYLSDSDAIEADLLNRTMWVAPNDGKVSGGTKESYNHDFKRLPNGNFMVLGNVLWKQLPAHYDTVAFQKKYPVRDYRDGKELARVEYGTIMEYNKNHELVWSWNSQNYFDKDMQSPPRDSTDFELKAHINAFSTDKKNEFVYAGFRDIDRIIKIDKKTGQVVNSWGDKLKSGEAREPGFFHKQHEANILDNGNIAVFNNNNYATADSPSSVVIFSQPTENSKSKVVWKFECLFDTLNTWHKATIGGNVQPLKNNNLLVCMGSGDRIFEITPAKKIVWDAVIESNEHHAFNLFHRLYRAYQISSLYPCYFTCQTNVDTVSQNASSFTVKIFNDGSDADSYHINIVSANGNYNKQVATPVITSRHAAGFEIKPVKNLSGADNIQVIVSSKTNPDRIKRLVVYCSK